MMNATNESLKKLIKEIKEIPDGDVDRYLIINEIKNIIKDSQKSISNRDIIAARVEYLASLPKAAQLTGVENIKQNALSLGFDEKEFEEFFSFLLVEILRIESEFLKSFRKEKEK